jgi:hypothetical protein
MMGALMRGAIAFPCCYPIKFLVLENYCRRQKAEGRSQKAEGRSQKSNSLGLLIMAVEASQLTNTKLSYKLSDGQANILFAPGKLLN